MPRALHRDKIFCTVVMNVMSEWLNTPASHLKVPHSNQGQLPQLSCFVFSVTHVNLMTMVNLFTSASFPILSNSLVIDNDIT